MARYKKSSKKSKGKNPLRYPVSPKESSPTFKDKLKVASDIIKFKPEKSIKLALIDKTQDIVDFDLGETTIVKKFGRPEDVIELHIYNLSNKILYSESNFKDYSFPEGSDATASEILIDFEEVLRARGFSSGKYSLKFNIHRNKIFNTEELEFPFYLKSISSTRTELSSTTTTSFFKYVWSNAELIHFVKNLALL